jgi:hypothetical protein
MKPEQDRVLAIERLLIVDTRKCNACSNCESHARIAILFEKSAFSEIRAASASEIDIVARASHCPHPAQDGSVKID